MSAKVGSKNGSRKSTPGKSAGSKSKKTPTDSRSAMERDQSRSYMTSGGGAGGGAKARSGRTRSSTSLSQIDRMGTGAGGNTEDQDPSPDLTSNQNPAANPRNMRRIIAEDPEWSLATVPCLTQLCLNHIVNNFDSNSTVLNKLPPRQRSKVLERIPTALPVKVTAKLVDDDSYWKKCCQTRWDKCDVSQYGGRWKRMFFERNLQDIIERFVPESTDPTELNETLALSTNYIRRLIVRQLLPPIRDPVRGRGNDIDGGSDLDDPLVEHFDFSSVLPALPFLEEFQVRYGLKNCGMNFDWNLFLFTTRDCQLLSKCLAGCRTLRVLRLNQSKVDDDKTRMLISQIIDHPVLQELDLSKNIIGDRGARAIGKFLNNRSQLTRLDLCSNLIGVAGAQALAHALTKNTTLVSLNLRLNHIGDEGGQALCRALLKNSTLTELCLAGDELSEPTAAAMSAVIQTNSTLRWIDLSCNTLGPDGGRQLQEGMEENRSITHMDLRLTECGQEAEFCIRQALDRNRERERMNAKNSINSTSKSPSNSA